MPDSVHTPFRVYNDATGMYLCNIDSHDHPVLSYEVVERVCEYATPLEAFTAAGAWLARYGSYPANVEEGLNHLAVVRAHLPVNHGERAVCEVTWYDV